MPLDLTDEELATAATACRAMAYQEGERAKKMENRGMRAPIENTAKRFAQLVEKFEAARKKRKRSPVPDRRITHGSQNEDDSEVA